MIVSFIEGRPKVNLSPNNCKSIGIETAKLHELTKNLKIERRNDLSVNSWRKILSTTDIGEGGTHDKYLNISFIPLYIRLSNIYYLYIRHIVHVTFVMLYTKSTYFVMLYTTLNLFIRHVVHIFIYKIALSEIMCTFRHAVHEKTNSSCCTHL